MKVDLTTNIGSLKFKNPVLTASGTFGYGLLMNEIFEISELGGIITKSITLSKREGNPVPRIAETACGILNSIGLENKGIDNFFSEILPEIRKLKTNIIASIAGETEHEYGSLAERLDKYVNAFEVNISCPNVKKGGMSFGQDLTSTKRVVKKVREKTSLPLIVKLTPNVNKVEDFGRMSEDNGANAISLVNTYKGLSIDVKRRKSKLGGFTGGLSGPAIKPLALYAVWKIARNVNIPVIGCGGITDFTDAIEFFMAGASLIEVGSATFRDPDASLSILEGIRNFLETEGIKNIKEIIGVIDEN
ncbi:dihydroorotate dehydrogenase [candidate division WOR-3 bacterium]|nr:dihydroorotate dehydrogenase [candidate division WOR-3 bacterium]